MQEEDIPFVQEIDQISFSTPWPKESFKHELDKNPNSLGFIVEHLDDHQKTIIAMAVVWVILDEAHIGTIAVSPDYRQKGVGRTLLNAILEKMVKMKVNLVYLEVRRSNTPARQLYESFGFEYTSTRKGYYQDTGEDALLMAINNLQENFLKGH